MGKISILFEKTSLFSLKPRYFDMRKFISSSSKRRKSVILRPFFIISFSPFLSSFLIKKREISEISLEITSKFTGGIFFGKTPLLSRKLKYSFCQCTDKRQTEVKCDKFVIFGFKWPS